MDQVTQAVVLLREEEQRLAEEVREKEQDVRTLKAQHELVKQGLRALGKESGKRQVCLRKNEVRDAIVAVLSANPEGLPQEELRTKVRMYFTERGRTTHGFARAFNSAIKTISAKEEVVQ